MQDKLIELKNAGWSHRAIAKELNISKSSVGYRLLHYKGEIKWPPLNDLQKQLLLGSLLGDASIGKRLYKDSNIGYYADFGHGEKQLSYLKLKQAILNGSQKIQKRKRDGINDYGGLPYYSFRFYHHRYLRGLYQLCIQNGKKTVTREWLEQLTPIGIAFWVQDDGYVRMGGSRRKDGSHKQPLISLATNGFTTNERQIIIDYFNETWNVMFRTTESGRSRFGRQIVTRGLAAHKFMSIISPYLIIPKILPGHSYGTHWNDGPFAQFVYR